ncbi:hypothetical protein C5167_018558 [Papaver somniferum]|uniref:Uncharacterized protein n=1 Tax=Papaver somniferum TaxID=3469 RepID=A0A4Y7IMK9_PAPSO|nr:hypothetical protein C5167_018558 [Papaver somniferum]
MSFSPLSWKNMVIKISTRRRQQRFTPGLMLSMVVQHFSEGTDLPM